MERYLVRRGLNRLILLPILLSIIYAAVVLWQLQRMLDERDWVVHTTEVITLGMDVQRHFALQESALRGALLTGDPRFRVRFAEEDTLVDAGLQRLHELIFDNPEQSARLDTILQQYWTWQSSARYSIVHDTAHGELVDRLTDRTMSMAAVRGTFTRFIARENLHYSEREDRFRRVTTALTLTIGVMSLAIGLAMGLYARRQANLFIRKFSEAIDESSQSRDLLRTSLMSIGDAIIVTDQFRSITLLNGRAEELTGWTIGDATGRKIDEVFRTIDERTLMAIENPVTTVLKEQRPLELRHHTILLSRKGVEFPIEDSAAPIRNGRRQIVGVVVVFRDITARRENERESEQREREFRALIENAPDVIIRYAKDLRITYVNPAIEHMLGVSPHALIGRRFKDVGIPEEVYFPWERAVQDVFVKQHSISTEIQYQTLHGVRRYQARLVPETSEDGIQSVISLSRDITEIKQIELRLRQSEQRFRGVMENSPNAFFLISALRDNTGTVVDFRYDYLNDKAGELLSLRPDECVGKRLLELLPGAQTEQFIQKYARIIDDGKPTREDHRATALHVKRAPWLRSQYIPIGDTLAISAEDITEQKKNEQALILSERRYRQLVDSAREAIFSTDETGRFTYTNPYIRELSGYSEQEATQFNFLDLVPPEHKSRVRLHFFRQFLSKEPASYIEAPFATKSGEKLWLSITSSLRMAGDEVEGFDCIATDVTEHHDREIALEAARDRAERSVHEATVRSEHLKEYLEPALQSMKGVIAQKSDHPVRKDLENIVTELERVLRQLT